MSSLESLALSEAQLTLVGLSLGVGLVMFMLFLAWCCFCMSICRDRRTQAKIRKQWRNAIERARQMSRRVRRGTQRRGKVHPPSNEEADGGRRPCNPQRVTHARPTWVHSPVAHSTPTHIDDINRQVMETIERSRSQPEHVSLAAIAANRSRSPRSPPGAVHPHRHVLREDSESSDDEGAVLPRAKVGPNEPPPSYLSCVIPNITADNASRVNYVAATHEFASASAPPLPGAVPTPILQRRARYPYNPEYTFMEEWPTQL